MITTLPPAPNRSAPSTFATLGDALLGALPAFVVEANNLQADVTDKQVLATTQATNAASSATLATNQAILAAASAAASAASSTSSIWVSGTTYAIGAVRFSPVNFKNYRRKTAGAGTTDPSTDSVNWIDLITVPTVISAAYTMPSTVASGYSLVLALSGTPALVGGSVASFEVTDWNGGVTTTAASANAASKTLTATTIIGQVLSVSMVAIDNYGNRSLPVVHTSTVIAVSINAATITSPANGATGITETPTISGNSFGVTGSTDTHLSTDWEIWTGANRTGTLIWSSINDTVNKTSITVPAATLVVNTTYYIAARYKGTTYGYGGYGYCSFTTATSFVATVAGTAYQGGFYAGRIVVGGLTYALVVAPKAMGENTAKQWKTTSATTAGTLSLNDGLSNSNAMNNASHPAAYFCRALTIGGYSDWYLPSRDELEIVYRNCKPDSTANNTASGANSNSSPVGVAYTAINPTTSVALAYTTGNAEVFNSSYYWSSTEFNASNAWIQHLNVGNQINDIKTVNIYVRAVRKVLI